MQDAGAIFPQLRQGTARASPATFRLMTIPIVDPSAAEVIGAFVELPIILRHNEFHLVVGVASSACVRSGAGWGVLSRVLRGVGPSVAIRSFVASM